MLEKIDSAAVNSGEVPALVVEFTERGKPIDTVAIVPLWVLEMIAGAE